MESYGWYGYIYDKKGDIPLALEYNHKSLDISIKINDKKTEGILLNNIGLIYQAQNEPNLAMEYLLMSLHISEELNDKSGIAYAYVNIGHINKFSLL